MKAIIKNILAKASLENVLYDLKMIGFVSLTSTNELSTSTAFSIINPWIN